jgi:hypothetical protein
MCKITRIAEEQGVHQLRESNNLQPCNTLSVPPISSNQYPYEPLDPSRNEIRLLRRFKTFEVDGLISCTLSHTSLDLNPTYEALSYTWCDKTGNAQPNKKVLLDGHIVAVTWNLEAALRQLPMSDQDKVLWIDALCINQADVAERNEQVSKMKLVYQLASGVISWLGEEYNDSREAFKLLQSILDVGLRKSICGELKPCTPAMALPDDIVRKASALVKLFTREYWKRAWVVQEVAFAQKLVFHCGTDHTTLEEIKTVCEAIRKDSFWLTNAFSSSGIRHIMWHLIMDGPNLVAKLTSNTSNEDTDINKLHARSRYSNQDVTLGGLLVDHRIKKATDPRDKVYSLLGLVSTEKRNRIPVDYNLQTRSIFQRVAAFIATEEQDLSILAENKTPHLHLSDLDSGFCLPSWVPNWANTSQGDKIRVDRASPWISASGSSIPDVFIHDPEVLCAKGICIRTITRVSMPMPDFDGDEFTFAPIFDAIYDWLVIFLSTGKKVIAGEQGFVNFLSFGAMYHDDSYTHGEIEVMERELLGHLKIVLPLYKPDDTTLIPRLGKQEAVVDDNTRREAEMGVWSPAPYCRKRIAFLVDGVVWGIGPQCTEVGDLVVVMLGCKVPLVLRKRTEDGGGYFNLGDAYIDGFINGEAVKDFEDGGRRSEIFELY